MVETVEDQCENCCGNRGEEKLWRGEEELLRQRRCRATKSFRGSRQVRRRGGSLKAVFEEDLRLSERKTDNQM